jgi:hypothetical protein
LLQQGESIVYVKDQLGHSSIQITVDTYGHLIPGANRAAVDGLDDDTAAHADAIQAQPEPFENPETLREIAELFGESGEPRRNRTYNPQIKRTGGDCPQVSASYFFVDSYETRVRFVPLFPLASNR